MSESSESDYQTIENLHILQKHVDRVLPPPVQKKVRDYFVQTFERNKRICFDLDISYRNATTLFLHWLIKYWPEREYGELFFAKNQL
jgi:hypothetical protein